VLAQYDRHARCAHLAQVAGVAPDEMHEALFGQLELELRSDQGEFDLPGLLEALHRHRGWRIAPADFLEARRQSTRVEPDMLSLCQALAAEVELAMFTNNGRWLAEHAEAIVPDLVPLFGGRMVCAGHLRVCKPEPEAYRACLERLAAQAAETLFIDDRADNVEGARLAGLDALLFENLTTLRAQLIHHGFLGGASHED
jgi:putative hydrolase of the HAD superfamily